MGSMGSEAGSRRVRREFSDEFKKGAVRLVLDEGRTIGGVARELDLTASSLAAWVRQARADRTKGKTGLTTEEREELARLRKENRELRLEREILKNLPARLAYHLLDQKLFSRLPSARSGAVAVRLLVMSKPVKKHGPGVAYALGIGDTAR